MIDEGDMHMHLKDGKAIDGKRMYCLGKVKVIICLMDLNLLIG